MLKTFISADWSKDTNKRSVYTADIANKRIQKEKYPGTKGWNLKSLLELAKQFSRTGPVLVGVDVVLGVPQEYWQMLMQDVNTDRSDSFVQWLGGLDPYSEFFVGICKSPEEWSVHRPWFKVPKGSGGLNSFAKKVNGDMKRRIDFKTNAKPVFAVSGIPGVVGGATRDFWQELVPHLAFGYKDFRIWPFDGELPNLLSNSGIVLAETYPGLAYAAALNDSLNTHKINIHKTKDKSRKLACWLLERAKWIVDQKIVLSDLGSARGNEDDFDALFTAAAVLRCVVEDTDIVDPRWIDPKSEGAMLLAGPVNPRSRANMLKSWVKKQKIDISQLCSAIENNTPSNEEREYSCPVPGCQKVFRGSRSGWDAHIASSRKHPAWNPDVSDGEERKNLFKREHNDWFRR